MLLLAVHLHAAEHPRLLFGPEDVPALREKIRHEPFASMFRRLKADVNTDNWGVGPMDPNSPGDRMYVGLREAFLYVLTGEDRWARSARGRVESVIDQPFWANPRHKGLRLYTQGVKVALVYDWCHDAPSWDAAFREKVSNKIFENAQVVFEHGGTEQNRSTASNWQALRFSGAGLMYLATDRPIDEARLERCFQNTARYLRDNLGTARDAMGWNIEGLGYTYYPMGNGVAPFAVAMHRRDPSKDLREVTPAARRTLWTVYAASVVNPDGSLWRPDFSDDNPGTRFEGTKGFAFWFCPPQLHPGLVWWYDRTVGAAGNQTWDNSRFGTIASILFHPGKTVEPVDPMTIPMWREGMLDTGGNGFFTFRNHYKDHTDVVAQIYAKFRGNRGHNGPDALSFRIAGLGTLWATGGGRYGLRTGGMHVYLRSMNTLYPSDPDGPFRTNGNSGRLVGKPVLNDDGGGAVTLAIDTNNLGVNNHTRHFHTRYNTENNPDAPHAAWVIADSSDNGLVWQMVTLETNQITTEGNTFTITSPDGHTLRGTVLYPQSALTFTTGSRPRGSPAGSIENNHFVHFSSPDGNYLVVLTLVKNGNEHPPITAEGTWHDQPRGSVQVGPWRFEVN